MYEPHSPHLDSNSMTFPSPFAAASKMCLSFIFRTWQKKKKKTLENLNPKSHLLFWHKSCGAGRAQVALSMKKCQG